ncbi:uncharacterized protein LOC141781743 [Sebastes fasciatus]|uniref:uncharacterized protein LOC141781743 n=1 Tax=Sebastes fasciatus TaxID=394691 RepID=UPI003D9F5600
MTAYSFNIFIIFVIHLSFIFHQSHGGHFEVIQPQSRTVNQDGLASISCEHTADVKNSVKDVRLNGINRPDETRLLCQMGKKDCKNIIMHQESLQKWLFIILSIGPEAMNMTYQCEFTVKIGTMDHDVKGKPTILLPGQKETICAPQPPPPQLMWILIGLLALMLLYSCVITFFYITLRCRNKDPENSIYVEMRKAPPSRNPHLDTYCV